MMRRFGVSGRAPAARRGKQATSIARFCRATNGELETEIEESTVPYEVDLVDLRYADPALFDEVRREGIKWRD
jgi:hypothetical protein